MSDYLDRIRPERYERAFSFSNLCYLLIDICFFHYKKRDFLAVSSDGMCDTYISKDAVRNTLEKGKEVFTSADNFAIFENGFRDVIEESRAQIAKTKSLESVSVNELYDFRAMVEKLYYYFEKTEFFFTDACYQEDMGEVTKRNLLVLGEDLKMESRPLLIELLTTCLYLLADLIGKDVRHYTFDEAVSLIETGKHVPASVIAERKESYVVYCEHDRTIPLDGEEKRIVLERFKKKDQSEVREFTGTIANKGTVTARARVVLPELDMPYEEFAKKLYAMEMVEGEILVTETTSPDFVPLMKKAGGIIANQGGMNSHAAIMSRELKVPCLVGTYHATDILSTGDLIELDAVNGIVRVLEKKNRPN